MAGRICVIPSAVDDFGRDWGPQILPIGALRERQFMAS
jgi:hypothetical protein